MSRVEADPPRCPASAEGATTRRPLLPVRAWALALTAGLIAGFASWLIGETFHGRFKPPVHATSRRLSHAELKSQFMADQAAQGLEATVAFGSLGAVLGLALGLAGGAARRSARTALIAAIVGSILGGTAAAAMTHVLLQVYFRILNPDKNDLVLAILIQGGIWSVIGAAGGAAFGIGLGDRSRAVRAFLGGLLGGIAGMLVYEMIGAVAFPLDWTSDPLSATWGTRLFARLALTTFASAGAVRGALDPVRGASQAPSARDTDRDAG